MLNIRRKSGTASLRYTVLAVGSLIMGMIGITNGVEITNSCVRYANSNYNCYEVEPGESYTLKGYELTVTSDLNFTSDDTEGILITKYTSSSSKNYTTTVFWNGTGLYHSEGHEGNGGTAIRLLSGAYVSDSTEYTGVINSLANQTLNIQPMSDILQTINGHGVSRIVYMLRADFQAYPYYCFIYDDIDYSFCISNDTNNQSLSNSVWNTYLEKKTGANYYNTPSELVTYLSNTYGISESPIVAGNGGSNTISLGTCPTIQQLIDAYPNEYNTGLCYSAKRLLTETGIVITTPQSIFELFPTYDEWKEGYITYQNYCKGTSTEICRQAFSGEQAQWSIYNKAPTDTIGIYQYCHLQLNITDKNTTTCVMSTGSIYATGVNEAIRKESMTNQSAVDIMIGSMVNMENVLPTSGSVLDALKPEGENRKINRNILESIQELYGTFMNLFHYRSGVQGIIPGYITWIILVILLFYILKK